ncbi:MAG: nucleotidyltransferase family protein [Planctomycetota bacterium]
MISSNLIETVLDKKDQVVALAARHGASNVRVFGSVANGTANQDSDIDFLVDLEQGRSLFDLGGLLMDLQELFGRKVDVVTENGLHWYIKDRVLREARPI